MKRCIKGAGLSHYREGYIKKCNTLTNKCLNKRPGLNFLWDFRAGPQWRKVPYTGTLTPPHWFSYHGHMDPRELSLILCLQFSVSLSQSLCLSIRAEAPGGERKGREERDGKSSCPQVTPSCALNELPCSPVFPWRLVSSVFTSLVVRTLRNSVMLQFHSFILEWGTFFCSFYF